MPAEVSRATTLTDVAQRAGVHPSTVSRVISRPGLVAEKTRIRVEAAIRELDFVPNPFARGLVHGRRATIGVLVPGIANQYFAALIQGAQNEARRHDLLLVLADTRYDPDEEAVAVSTLRAHVDGLILCSPMARVPTQCGVPFVYVNVRSSGVSSITVDQSAIVRMAAQHLEGLGHRRVVMLNGSSKYSSFLHRTAAIKQWNAARERDGAELVEICDFDPSFEGGRRSLEAVRESGATAVLAVNDVMGLGVIAAASEAGVAIPTDLSVMGSDGIEMAAMSWPALTTVASPLEELGRGSVQLLVSEVGGQRTRKRNDVLQPQLIVRDSTGPVPRSRRPGASSTRSRNNRRHSIDVA